jgi:hypothetical protein
MQRWLSFIILVCCVVTFAHTETNKNKSTLGKTTQTIAWSQGLKQGFNMRVWLSTKMTMGIQAVGTSNTDVPDGFGLEYPNGSGVEHLFGGGPWLGGKVDGVIHVDEGYNGDDARNEFIPERKHAVKEHFWRTSMGASQRAIDTHTPDSLGYSGYYFVMNPPQTVDSLGCDNDGDGLVNEDPLDGVDNDGDWNLLTDDVGADGLADQEEVSCDGVPYNSVSNPDPAGDNYEPRKTDKCHPNADGTFPYKVNADLYTEKNGIADHGEPHVDEDYGAVSNNDLYCSATDTFSTPVVPSHVKMYVKVIQKSFAWSSTYAGAILPFEYSFINLSKKVITDAFVGYFADIDLGPVSVSGYYQNDYAQYWDSLRTGFIHNAIDRGSTPLAVTVLKTPRALDSLEYVWQWFDFTTRNSPGTDDSILYTWMDGSHFSNQKIATNQSPTNPSDTRFFFSFGRFNLAPLETLNVTIALVSGQAVSEGVDNLRENVEKAIKLARRGWITPIELKSPKLSYEIQDNSIKLTWYPHVGWDGSVGGPYNIWDDSNHYVESTYPETHWRRVDPPCGSPSACPGAGSHICVDGKLPGGRTFTGFRLYRSENVNDAADEKSFTMLREYTLPDTASLWSIEHLDSVFVDSFLVRGKRYWYSVTAFGLPDITILPVPVNDTLIRYDTLKSESSESTIGQNATRVDVPFDVSRQSNKTLVVPNPYRVDRDYTYENGGWEKSIKNWDETKRRVKFIHLPEGEWTLRIFTLTGDQIITITNTIAGGFVVGGKQQDSYNPSRGEIEWFLLSETSRALASGVYVYSVESKFGTQIDKFVLIR